MRVLVPLGRAVGTWRSKLRDYRLMLNRGRIAVAAAVMAAFAAGCSGPAGPAPMPTSTVDIRPMVEAAIATALAPAPTPTSDLQSMVAAAVDATLAAAATPAPTYTPRPTRTPTPRPTLTPASIYAPIPTVQPARIYLTVQPPRVTVVPSTPTPMPERLEEMQCGPDCDTDYRQPWGYVEWVQRPSVSISGVLTLSARIDEGIVFIPPGGNRGYTNISLTDTSVLGRDGRFYGSIVPPGWNWVPNPGLWIASEYRYSNRTLTVRAQIDPAAAKHPRLELCIWSGGTREQNQLLDCVRVQQP